MACWAEPSVMDRPNFWPSVPVRMAVCPCGRDAGDDPHHDLLAGAHRHQRGQPGDLAGTVDDDAPDAQPDGGGQVLRALGVAVHHDLLRREAGGDGQFQFPGGADVQAEALLLHPVGDGAAQERLGGVDDVGVGERGAVRTAAFTHFLLVEYVQRGAEAVGGLGQGHPADADVAAGGGPGGGRPDGERPGLTGHGRGRGRGDFRRYGDGGHGFPPSADEQVQAGGVGLRVPVRGAGRGPGGELRVDGEGGDAQRCGEGAQRPARRA